MCGVFGIYDSTRSPERDVARLTYFGLFALQHRGQESAGIAVSNGEQVMAMTDMGLVSQVFDEFKLSSLQGHMAIGHARYSTTGTSAWHNAQPVVAHGPHRKVALGHNGNLTNTAELRDQLRGDRVRLQSTSDTEVIAALIARHEAEELDDAVADTMSRIEGAFAAVVMTKHAVAGFRDPHGIRPLVVGRLDGAHVLASETCALDIIGAELERELDPGEMVVIDDRGARYRQAVERRSGSLCIFEYIYFARPDSQMTGQGLYEVRRRMGEQLAMESPGRRRHRDPGTRLRDTGRGRAMPAPAGSRSGKGWSRTATSGGRSSSPIRACANAASSSSSTCFRTRSADSAWWWSTTPSSAGRPPASWWRCCSRPAPSTYT